MREEGSKRPPIDPEQWLDLIIASASHWSSNEGQRRFGEILLQRYFVSLPARYIDDKVASAYFDESLCVVASGIRGFSVVRDLLQTNWDKLRRERDEVLHRAEALDAFSPLRKGHWGFVISAIVATGIALPLRDRIASWAQSAPLYLGLSSLATIIVLMVTVHFIVVSVKAGIIRTCEHDLPRDLLESWEDNSLNGYRKVAQQVFPLLVEIADRYYPDSCNMSTEGESLDQLIEKHFAFKLRHKRQPHT